MGSVRSLGTLVVVIVMAISAIGVVSVFQIVGNSGLLGPSGTHNYGTLKGSVSIGPCCPVEQAGISCCPSDIYSSRQLVLRQRFQAVQYIPLGNDGSFSAQVAPGQYGVGLTNCTYIGCYRILLEQVNITAGETTILNLSVDTGIR